MVLHQGKSSNHSQGRQLCTQKKSAIRPVRSFLVRNFPETAKNNQKTLLLFYKLIKIIVKLAGSPMHCWHCRSCWPSSVRLVISTPAIHGGGSGNAETSRQTRRPRSPCAVAWLLLMVLNLEPEDLEFKSILKLATLPKTCKKPAADLEPRNFLCFALIAESIPTPRVSLSESV
jgi:hypothetical protein